MIFLDFEFNETLEEFVNLVCCTTRDSNESEPREWWLHNNKVNQEALADYLKSKRNEVFVAWSAVAEGRSFLSLGLDPRNFKWRDLFLEYRCLTNHNDELQYGKQLIDGKVRLTKHPKPKWERTEEDAAGSFKPKHSLVEATYKLLEIIRDHEHKDQMRDLIISAPESFSAQEAADIQAYCTEDVVLLDDLDYEIIGYYKKYLNLNEDDYELIDQLMEEMILRGHYAAITAVRESRGYPQDLVATKNLANAIPCILDDCQREINELFPDIKPFKYNRPEKRYSMQTKVVKDWIRKNCNVDDWMETDTGDISLALDAWTRFFDFKHDYPKDNFGAQMVRYLKLKQNLAGFSKSSKKRSFWDFVGKDNRVRPYMNIYGSQASRSQPSATGFMFLKPAWMRSLVQPKLGKAIGSIDYGSEEFFISALLSRDDNMIDAYLSGDVYLAFAKLAGMVPEDGTKDKYKAERDLCKATVLGLSYLMSKYGLANKLSQDTGEEWTPDDAQKMIDLFYSSYPDFKSWQEGLIELYKDQWFMKMPCGWYMWGDNDNFRSISNVPVQGFGASIMRKADELANARGLNVILTLHDALYIEFDHDDYGAMDTLKQCMIEAFVWYFDEDLKETAAKIKLDPFIWSPNYPAPEIVVDGKGKKSKNYSSIVTPLGWEIDMSDIYVDERSQSEYDQFSKYFRDTEDNYL